MCHSSTYENIATDNAVMHDLIQCKRAHTILRGIDHLKMPLKA